MLSVLRGQLRTFYEDSVPVQSEKLLGFLGSLFKYGCVWKWRYKLLNHLNTHGWVSMNFRTPSVYLYPSCGGLSGRLGVGLKTRPEPQREGKAEPPPLPCCPFSHLQWLLSGYRAAGAACPTDPAQVRERGGSADSCSCLCWHWEAGCQDAVGPLFPLAQVHGHLLAPAFPCWVPFPQRGQA